jgi:dipeptidyl aminopeptidase/acylaminoacyl peptidase
MAIGIGSRTNRRVCSALSAGLLIALAGQPASAAPAAPKAPAEGTLDASIDTESGNSAVQLRALQQEVYVAEEYMALVLFRQQCGDRVAAERINIPTVDAGAEPAYVFSPRTLAPGKPYPGLVIAHGSYHGALDPAIFSLIAAAVSKGYIVIFPEYRGSRGYGQEQYDAIDFGGKEVDDVVAAADYLSDTRPVPKDRIALYGRSKGGMVALLAIERFPSRFKAAVDVVGITDMVAYMAYKPGFRGADVAKQPRFGGKTIAQEAAPYIDVSPLNHVEDIQTPLLVHATTGDKTAPVQLHGGRLIDLLKAHNKVVESKIYDMAPGGHVFSEVDSAQARDSEKRIFDFLGKYMRP